ncbi:MAG: hypothetical protein ACR2HG_07265 [Pyrinomonadaceae bacterium]
MKNKFGLAAAFLILLVSVLACSFYNPLKGSADSPGNNNSTTSKSDDKSTSEKTTTSTDDEDKIGVPECDELLDYISEQSKNQNDDYVTKATREFFLNRIRDSEKKSIEENKNNTEELAKSCKDYRKQLDKFKSEEKNKNQ